MKREFVSVLDLGTSKAACLVAEPDERYGVRVLGVAEVECKGVRKGAVSDLEETARAIDNACRRAQQEAGRDIDSVFVAVGGNQVECVEGKGFVPIYPRMRSITRDDVLQVVNHSRQTALPPDREQIVALPRDFRVDGQAGIARPVGMVGSRLEVSTFLATADVAQIQNIERALGMTGRKADAAAPMALASALGVLTAEEIEHGAAVADIGAGGTQVAIFDNGSIVYSAFVPVGSGHVTSDLSKLLKTSPEEAERLKQMGSAEDDDARLGGTVEVLQIGQMQARPLDRRVLNDIIESRMRELATMVRQQLERSGRFATLAGGLALTGGGSRLAGAPCVFEHVMGTMKVRTAAPRLGPTGKMAERPELAAAVGLARFALDSEDDELAVAGANGKWSEKVKTLWSMVRGKG